VRGGQSPLRLKEEEIPSTEELKEQSESNEDIDEDIGGEDKVEEEIEEGHIAPHQDKILEENPKKMPFWRAVRYIFSIRTNVLLIIASSLGYFFFTGMRTFAVVLMHNRFDISQGTSKLIVVVIGLGAIIGVLITGRTADRLIERGHISARVTVSADAFLATSVLFLAGFFITSIYIASVLFFLASICLGGTIAPMDAARLDIMHSRLWGRAESVRTTLRLSFEAVAPILFGWVSTLLGGQTGTFGASSQNAQANNAAPLDHTFMIMLAPVIIAAFILYLARKPYPRDVATALASEKAAQDE
jgi:MFS family permease